MKQKTIDCLHLMGLPLSERETFYTTITEKHSEKAVQRKIQELARRGLVTLAETDITQSKLTRKGMVLLENAEVLT